MKITALLENTTAREDMQTEHGLSLYIETARHRILFDMGQSACFLENAHRLGVALSEVDLAVLSHGHYDHGGGLGAFLSCNHHAPVYVHRDAFLPHYNGTEKYIGLDVSLASHPRIRFTDEELRIDESLSLFSCNQRERHYATIPSGLTERVGECFLEDDFRHEQYLLIEEEGKRVLISGCSHKGILDIVSWFSPDVLVGGFHFSKLPPDAQLSEAAALLASHPTEYYTCHCTGKVQFDFLHRQNEKLHYLSCGEQIIV